MSRVIIESTDEFRLDSIGNGAAYEMTNKSTGESRFIQYGDAATDFRKEYDDMVQAHTNPQSVWYHTAWNACLRNLFYCA